MEYIKLRQKMVHQHLAARDITDKRVLKVMGEVPREEFIPKKWRSFAYADQAISIGYGQTISQPYIVALMCQLLKLKGEEKVLDVGTGSGYQAAVLSRLVKQVITIERIPQLANSAKARLKKMGFGNVSVVVGDGYQGYPKQAPYDAIKAAAAAETVPPSWEKQLKIGGRMVFPLGDELIKIKKTKKGFVRKNYGGVAFVPLITDR